MNQTQTEEIFELERVLYTYTLSKNTNNMIKNFNLTTQYVESKTIYIFHARRKNIFFERYTKRQISDISNDKKDLFFYNKRI